MVKIELNNLKHYFVKVSIHNYCKYSHTLTYIQKIFRKLTPILSVTLSW